MKKSNLVNDALVLFEETMNISSVDIDTQNELFYSLYNKECDLFELLGKMSESETEEYKAKIRLLIIKVKMKDKLEKIKIQMEKLNYKPLYYLQKDWIILREKEDLLQELLVEINSL